MILRSMQENVSSTGNLFKAKDIAEGQRNSSRTVSGAIRKLVTDAFVEKLDSFAAIKTVRLWWNSIPHAITVTAVGRVLAHANAKRCDPSIPNLN
jgi:hypothetical protein